MRRIKQIQQETKHKRITEFISCPLRHQTKIANCDESDVKCCLVKEVKQIWIKAGFPIIGDDKIKLHMIKLHMEYANLRKNSNVTAFKEKLNRLFDIADKDIENIIQSDKKRSDDSRKNDLEFLKDQRGLRKRYLGSEDRVYKQKVAKIVSRQVAAEKSAKKEKEREQSIVYLEDSEEDVDDDVRADDFEEPTSKKHKPRPEFVTLTLPTRILGALTAEVAKSNKLSVRKTTSIVAKLINIGGGDLEDFSFSKSLVHQQSNSAIKERAIDIRKDQKVFLQGKKLTLHFDGKLVKYFTDGIIDTYERCAVMVSSPDFDGDVLLGVPRIQSSAGSHQVDGLLPLLDEWGIKEDLFSVCCDSTATQTGKYSGAITLLQNELEQPIIWVICRRHVMEVHAKHAMVAVFGPTTAPYDPIFKRLQDNWNKVSGAAADGLKEDSLTKFNWRKINWTLLGQRAEEVLQFCQRALTLDTFARGDYRKLCSLAVLYLGGVVQAFSFPRPGAMHNARFMSKGIYLIMLTLLQEILPFLTDEEKDKINRVNIFCVLWYVPWFLQSYVVEKAPSNDLLALQQMKQFAEFDSKLASAVYTSISRHGWYLSEKMCMLSIVDEDLEDIVRRNMALKLLLHKVPETFSVGYPEIQSLEQIKDLSDLVGPESWFIFRVAGLDEVAWLNEKVEDWPNFPSYKELKMFISRISVVNDCSERGVKLIQEYVDSARNEDLRQDILTTAKVYKSKINSQNMNKGYCYSNFLF